MRNNHFLIPLILLFGFPFALMGQNSQVHDNQTLQSKHLKSERKYAVYLPPGYEDSNRSYPVLYLLHGAGDDQTGWVQFGEVQHIADKAILEGKSTPMIIIMPDARTGRMGYFNHPQGDWNYEDFFFEELIPHVEQKYRTRPTKEFRSVAGLSMGGGGSFMYALKYPDMFSSSCPLSAYIGPSSVDEIRRIVDIENIPQASLEKYVQEYNALTLIENMPDEQKDAVRWYIDCGDDDFLYEGNSLIHIAMKKKEIPHEFRIRDGGHTWSYWRTALPDVLAFVSKGFHR
ncbi:alpha/beta hydrolase [Pararhodonellum marinum]|uniref:alpha/beta hydrolase n=1 Tax=Pararhodonellum marinum TaxID=2755358 RepID=UPI0018903A96|nr:alpha/beta hydrolase-fold protein [Pararhodonellum marinum]